MSTVGKDLWFQILRNDGRYEDDPLPLSLWTYIDQGDKVAYKICYNDSQEASFLNASYDPDLAWYDGELTGHGKRLLKEQEESHDGQTQ